MGAFEYKALDGRGKKKSGIIEADSARAVRQILRDKGMSPLAVEASSGKQAAASGNMLRRGGSISVSDLSLVTRQLAILVQSAIPIEEALGAIAQQTEKKRIKSMMLGIRSKILEGYSLAESLGEYPSAFPKLYRSTVAAGEHAGHLDLVLNRLADYTEARQIARQKVQLAAIYPVILSFVAIGIVVFLLAYVVPDVVGVFMKNGQELPPLTRALLAASDFVQAWGLLILVLLIGFGAGFRYMLRKEAFRKNFHHKLLHFPVISRMSRGINTARFASTLSILNSSGVPLVEAIRIAGEVLSNEYLRDRVLESAQRVSEGASLHRALEETGYFPPMMLHMIGSGETSGELDKMLEKTATTQENDLQGKMAAAVALFEPLMLLLMGAVVMIIVLAIMLPILNMSNLVG